MGVMTETGDVGGIWFRKVGEDFATVVEGEAFGVEVAVVAFVGVVDPVKVSCGPMHREAICNLVEPQGRPIPRLFMGQHMMYRYVNKR